MKMTNRFHKSSMQVASPLARYKEVISGPVQSPCSCAVDLLPEIVLMLVTFVI